MSYKMGSHPGEHIRDASTRALAESRKRKLDVTFDFNDTPVTVTPKDSVDAIVNRWHRDREIAHEKRINSPEYKAEEKRRAEELAAKMAASMKETAVTETEMRDAQNPWPYTMAQLTEYIDSLTHRQHDYGTCVYAMSLAALAAFNLVARELGVTGFQSSCAGLDFIRRNRSIKGPFILLKGEDELYPQCQLSEKLAEALAEWEPWIAEQARARLLDTANAHPNVLAHWRKLGGVTAAKL